MRFSNIQKSKLILAVNFIALCFIIISTPYFIRTGFYPFSEEVVEAFFISVGLIALFIVFKHYDAQMEKKEEEAQILNMKLEKKERELLNALEYLGRVNVQVSMIKALLERTKVPSTRSQLFEVFSELLRVVCSITKENSAHLRIVNLENFRTLSEHMESVNGDENSTCLLEAGNKKLAEMFAKREKKVLSGKSVFYSDIENFSLKAFVLVPSSKNNEDYSKEKRVFLETIANQCEIVFVLFNSRYFKSK